MFTLFRVIYIHVTEMQNGVSFILGFAESDLELMNEITSAGAWADVETKAPPPNAVSAPSPCAQTDLRCRR